MDLNLIKKLIKVLDSSDLTDLEVEENGFRIKIAKKIRLDKQFINPSYITGTNPGFDVSVSQSPAEEVKENKEETKKENTHEVRSPIVGTLYRAPAPDADPYVQVGDTVSAGAVLCIIEAMKLMNEIESDVNGKIIKILAENGKPVEYNQPLFLIQTD
jgi:acetyl-CoA carboxylase biotin carboxyl carrier protein